MTNITHRLPVFQTIWSAVKLPVSSRNTFGHVGFVLYPVMVFGTILHPVAMTSASHSDIWRWIDVGIITLTFAFMAVAWHRLLVLGESTPQWRPILRRGVIYTMIIIFLGPVFNAGFGVLVSAHATVFTQLASVISLLFYAFILVPLASLFLPIVATENRGQSVNSVVRLLRGNWARFFWVILIGGGVASLLIIVSSAITGFVMWDLLLAVLGVELAGPGEVNRLLLVALFLPSALVYALVYLYVSAFVAGLLSLSYELLKQNAQ